MTKTQAAVSRRRTGKYHAVRTTIDGITFDSRSESRRYEILKEHVASGLISNLELQVPFTLYAYNSVKKIGVACGKYVCDFQYIQDGVRIVEDVKGVKTALYRWKKKMMKENHDIDIFEVPANALTLLWQQKVKPQRPKSRKK